MMTNSHSSFTSHDGKDHDYSTNYPSKGLSAIAQGSLQVPAPEDDSRNSWEENDSDGDLYPTDAYTYGRDDDDEDDDEDDDDDRDDSKDKSMNGTLTPKVLENGLDKQDQEDVSHPKTFDQGDDKEAEKVAPNVNQFRVSGTLNARASINSGRSYSSNTKHHSFGYDKDRPEPSDSESESRSESDSDHDDRFVNAPSPPPVQASVPEAGAAAASVTLKTIIKTNFTYSYKTGFKAHSKAILLFTFRRSIRATLSGGRYSQQQHRGSSFSDLSDAELNDVSLDSRPSTPKRNSGIFAPKPQTPTVNAGFPSSFFGGKPHPKSQQYQQGASSPGTSPSVLPASTASTDARTTAAAAASGGVLSGSFSSIASSIQGAFRFASGSSSSTAALPPPPTISRSSSRTGTRVMAINTSSVGFDVRSSNNVSPERASTYSTMTTDSNMDLLLARLEAQNSMLEVDAKRRMTSDLEMDRAIGNAKEESVSEDVDWDYWGALMHDYNGMAKKNPKQLTQMIQKGIPPSLRGLIWQVLAKSKDGELEAKYADLLKETSAHEKQINRDMNRTFPNHEYFQAEGLGQESLFNVVKAYSLYDTEVGYCQGLSFVVGPLLLNNMPDEEAFCVLVKLMSTYDMRGHFTPDMNTLQLRLFQFEQLMEETVPLVYKHFQLQGIRSTMYASQWFMTLFAYKFPLDLVFRVYDILFVEGIDSLLRFAVALLKANHDRILGHEFETLVEFLKNGLFEHYKNDPSLFIQDAYNIKVTPKKVTQYTQKYNAMLQRQQAELAAEESLRENNKLLSNEVRRLEGALHTLNKEHVDLAKELITRKMEMAQLHDQNDVLLQKVSDLTKIVDSQAKEVEDRFRAEIQALVEKNMELAKKCEQAEDQNNHLESLLIDSKMKYAQSENEREALTRKLGDLRKALGVA
ncbi:GTPase-activating protein [Mortierella sp. NVP85]|nr:GTPase-activating protein [Mortierella sp. NVP85]